MGQVALRFPGDLCVQGTSSPLPGWSRGWHIDGLPHDLPSMPAGRIDNFSCLVGVCLSDCTADNMGNLVAYPGSHWAMQDWLQDDGNLAKVLASGSEALPRAPRDWSLPLRPPQQVKMRAGDVVVAHYNLAHSIAPNTGGASHGR
jgi:ectoine hydroxylase-related dioxygenase (phytanoyl-CoA dioxygenase family)